MNFSYNWNKKLNNLSFTTLRVMNKYHIGEIVPIVLNGKTLYQAEIIDKKNFKIDKINNFISYIDTGYSPEETKKILYKMYKNKCIDWKTQLLTFYLLKRI